MTPACPTPPKRADDVQVARKLAELVRDIATAESLQRIDLFAAMTDASERWQQAGKTLEWTAGPALTPSGHALAMCLTLDALGVKPRVSSAELDLKADAPRGTHCSVTRLEKQGGTFTFKRTDHCLPTAFPQSVHAALDFFSVPHNWDSYRIKVVGLPAGSWRIAVEGMVAGTFTAEALANGVDLGRSPGPWQTQAKKIHEESLALEEQFRSRCRNGARPKIPEEAESLRSALVRRLDALLEEREAKCLHRRQVFALDLDPHPHRSPTVNATRNLSFALIALFSTVSAVRANDQNPPLAEGDCLAFIGDSITEQMIYTRYVMNYFTCHYPGVNIRFYNRGISGSTARFDETYVQQFIDTVKPTVASICFGMNDGAYCKFDQAGCDRYAANMRQWVRALKAHKIRVVLLTPGCCDEERRPQLRGFYNDTLERLAQEVKKIAAEEKVAVYDLHRAMRDIYAPRPTRRSELHDDPRWDSSQLGRPSPNDVWTAQAARLRSPGLVGVDRCRRRQGAVEAVHHQRPEVIGTRAKLSAPGRFAAGLVRCRGGPRLQILSDPR